MILRLLEATTAKRMKIDL